MEDKLNIIFRSCSEVQVRPGTRIVDCKKSELIIRCLNSLINSIHWYLNNDVQHMTYLKLTVIDDHSSEECIEKIKKSLSQCDIETEFISMSETTGNGQSMKFCYEYAKENAYELIYFVEDDYLHTEKCIAEMLINYKIFKNNLGDESEVIIYPVDCPLSYQPQWIVPCRVVTGRDRHWRTNYHTPWTMMITKNLLLRYWLIYMKFSEYTDGIEINEDNTINNIYRTAGVYLFNPLPTLAFHIGFNNPPVYYEDWKTLWKRSIKINGFTNKN